MVTYASTKVKKSQYLNAKTETGAKILNYIKRRCEKALAFCLEQNLTKAEDFADVLEELTLSDGKPAVSAKITKGGFVLTMTEHPDLGTTTGRYMMQHLGYDDEEQKKFTVAGIESLLNPQKNRSNLQLNDLLEDIDEKENKLDDLLDEINQKEENNHVRENLNLNKKETKTQKQKSIKDEKSNQLKTIKNNKKLDIDHFLDSATQISGKIATQSNEIDGVTFAGMSSEIVFLSTLLGKKATENFVKMLQKSGKKEQLLKIIDRLKKQNERAENLIEKTGQFEELVKKTSIQIDENNQFEEEKSKSIGDVFGQVIKKINQKINRIDISKEKDDSININQKVNFDEQLIQINIALNHIDKKLDYLEQRIESIEQTLNNEVKKEESKTLDKPLVFPYNSTVQKTNLSSSVSQECAEALFCLYSRAQQEANERWENIVDGIPLGDNAILYLDKDDYDKVSLTVETIAGKTLFNAISNQKEWVILYDNLTNEDKKMIIKLPETLVVEEKQAAHATFEYKQENQKRKNNEIEI